MIPIPLSAFFNWINVWGRLAERDKIIAELTARLDRQSERIFALEEELAAYRKIGSIVCDSKGIITKCGAIMTEMAGYIGDELLGRSIKELIPFKYWRDHDTAFQEVVKGVRPMRDSPYEVELLRKDGTQVAVLVNLTIMPNESALQFRADIRRRW